jgi:hypothetical protein
VKRPLEESMMATTSGYRVWCDKLPPHGEIVIEMATTVPGIPQTNNVDADDYLRKYSFSDDSDVWYGHERRKDGSSNDSAYTQRAIPAVVHVYGRYSAMQRFKYYNKDVKVLDQLKEFEKNPPPRPSS